MRLNVPAIIGSSGHDAVIAGSQAPGGRELLPGEVTAAAGFEFRALPGAPDSDVDRGDRYRAPRPAADRDGPRLYRLPLARAGDQAGDIEIADRDRHVRAGFDTLVQAGGEQVLATLVGQRERGEPLDVVGAEVAGHEQPGREAVFAGERLAVHLIGDDPTFSHRGQRQVLEVAGAVDAVELTGIESSHPDDARAGPHPGGVKQRPHRDSPPAHVRHPSDRDRGLQRVTEALQYRGHRHRRQRAKLWQADPEHIVDKAINSQRPVWSGDPRDAQMPDHVGIGSLGDP